MQRFARLILAVFLVGVVVMLLWFYTKRDTSDGLLTTLTESDTSIAPTASAFPFQEMTIPYLRTRDYRSALGELALYAENSRYTSYLTSYDSDGLQIHGLLTIPSGEQPPAGWPAVVFVHGYITPTTYRTTSKYEAYVDYLARQGMVIFKIDLRGHGTSEGEPGGAYYSSDYLIDVLNARAALQGASFVNARAIGLWGHSMAGNVVFRAIASRPEIPAAVIWAGAGYTYDDFRTLGVDDNSYRPPQPSSSSRRKREEMFALYGQFDSSSSFWRQVPGTNYLSDLQTAVQIHHAANDPVVNVEYSRGLVEHLAASRVPHEYHEYATGGHNIDGTLFSLAMERTAQFFLLQLQKAL